MERRLKKVRRRYVCQDLEHRYERTTTFMFGNVTFSQRLEERDGRVASPNFVVV